MRDTGNGSCCHFVGFSVFDLVSIIFHGFRLNKWLLFYFRFSLHERLWLIHFHILQRWFAIQIATLWFRSALLLMQLFQVFIQQIQQSRNEFVRILLFVSAKKGSAHVQDVLEIMRMDRFALAQSLQDIHPRGQYQRRFFHVLLFRSICSCSRLCLCSFRL